MVRHAVGSMVPLWLCVRSSMMGAGLISTCVAPHGKSMVYACCCVRNALGLPAMSNCGPCTLRFCVRAGGVILITMRSHAMDIVLVCVVILWDVRARVCLDNGSQMHRRCIQWFSVFVTCMHQNARRFMHHHMPPITSAHAMISTPMMMAMYWPALMSSSEELLLLLLLLLLW
jgi:hypothetical protein